MIRLLRALRSTAAFALLLPTFALAGAFQRLLIWPLVRLFPRCLDGVMSWFMHLMAAVVLGVMRLGGARIRSSGQVPTAEPALILMNHQSLLDIPRVVSLCRPRVPMIVTRRRYGRGIPMISPMLRIRSDPLVDPEADPRGSLAVMKAASRRQRHGVVVFPEGHRSPDGEIEPFATAGLKAMLRERPAPVWLVVTDGFSACRTIGDFLLNIHKIDGRTEVLGPFEPPGADAEIRPFIERMRKEMIHHLRSMRQRDHGGA